MASNDVTIMMPPDPAQVVDIWTDGGCKPNPGPGGWAAIMIFRDVEREISGFELETTNNRMELTAAATALEALKRPCQVRIYTDSEYVKNGITTWIHGWKKRGWRTADNKPVKNIELWQRLDVLAAGHEVQWHWVRGHTGDPGNERADALANRGVESLRAAR